MAQKYLIKSYKNGRKYLSESPFKRKNNQKNENKVGSTNFSLYICTMIRLNSKEETVMQILWRMKRAFTKEILAEMPEPKPPITTLSSIVRKLQEDGLIGFEAFGRTHRYFPILKKEEYRKSAFQQLMKNYFSNSPEQLLSFFVEEEKLDNRELDELLNQIKESSKK